MKKEIIPIIVFLIMILPIFNSQEIKAATIRNNGLGGISIDINSAPYTDSRWRAYGDPYGQGGCTWFVGARVMQLTGKGTFNTQVGRTWYNSYGPSLGFSTGQSIQAPAVICWSGHVAILEKIEGGMAYISEGGNRSYPSNAYTTIKTVPVGSVAGLNSNFLGCVYFQSSVPQGSDPVGTVDSVTSPGVNQLRVAGWAYDPDNTSAQIEIHVYVGGEGHNLGPASGNRQDVDNVHHCGAFHGFDKTITTSKSGNQKVDIYAINVGGGNNRLLYSNTVNIVADMEKPTISNIYISNINEKGYTVSCDVSDNIGVTSVKFPTWRTATGNPVWYDGVKEYDNRWSFVFDKADIIDAKYVTHIYAYDAAGNTGSVGCNEVTVMKDTEAPQITKLEVKEVSKNKIILHVEATDNNLLGAFTVLSNVMYSNNAVGKLVTEYGYSSVYDNIGECNYSGNIDLEGHYLSNVPVYLNVAVRDASGNASAVKTISAKCMGEEDNYAEINLKQGESIKTSEIKQCFGCGLTSVEIWLNESEDAILELENPGTDNEAIVAKKSGSEYVYFVNYMSRQQVGAKINVKSDTEPELKEGSAFTVEDGTLTGLIQGQNTVKEIAQEFKAGDLIFTDMNGKALTESDSIGTGATVSVMDGDSVTASCQVVLAGDITGDGKVNGKDVSMLARSLVGKGTLNDIQKAAADVLEDDAVNGKDVSKLARSLVGKSTIASQDSKSLQ